MLQAPSWLLSLPDTQVPVSLPKSTGFACSAFQQDVRALSKVLEVALGLGSMRGGVELPSAKSELWALWPYIQVERLTGSGAQARKRLDDTKPSCLLPSPSSLSGTPDPGLRTPISSGNLGSPSQGPVAQFSQEASARVTTLSPAVDSSPDPGVQQLPKGEPETDLSPELPAAHLIGKHLADLKSASCAPPQRVRVLWLCYDTAGPFPNPPPPFAPEASPLPSFLSV